MNSFYFGFCITFSEDAKITSIYSVTDHFELSWHVIIRLTFHSDVTDHVKKKQNKTKNKNARKVSNTFFLRGKKCEQTSLFVHRKKKDKRMQQNGMNCQ